MKKTLQDLTIKDPFMLFEKMIQDEREAGRAADASKVKKLHLIG